MNIVANLWLKDKAMTIELDRRIQALEKIENESKWVMLLFGILIGSALIVALVGNTDSSKRISELESTVERLERNSIDLRHRYSTESQRRDVDIRQIKSFLDERFQYNDHLFEVTIEDFQ